MFDGVSLKFMLTMTWHSHYLEKENMALNSKKVADPWAIVSGRLRRVPGGCKNATRDDPGAVFWQSGPPYPVHTNAGVSLSSLFSISNSSQ